MFKPVLKPLNDTVETAPAWVAMGYIAGLYGIRGWVKVVSHTEPVEGIIDYAPLYYGRQDRWTVLTIERARVHGKGMVIKFAGYEDRDAAAALVAYEIAVRRDQLPELPPGEYYWADLQGLRVVTVDGVDLGAVERLFETGANDVLVVQGDRERLIPFLQGDVIKEIDLQRGAMCVDWDPTF